ncbi:MAG: DUF3991 domain-containing protein [Hydrococcus sp. RM1_1_31]|nr:DUF3991 domain-containing protein [Hydrococcus sp. RM1_1_31]
MSEAVEKLTIELVERQNSNSLSLSAIEQLNGAIANYTAQLNNESRLSQPLLSSNPRDLAQAINNLSESEETEAIALPLARFTGHIQNYQVSTNELNRLTESIEQLHQSIANKLNQQTIQEALLEIANYVEHSAFESEPQLHDAIEKLTLNLEAQKLARKVDALTRLNTAIIHYAQQLKSPPIVTPASGSMFDPTDNPTVAANNETKPIEIDPPNEQVIISQKLEFLSQQLEDLQPKTRKQFRERDFLSREIANLQAYSQLSPGQQVSKDKQIGTVTELKLTKGGMPEAWVQWDNYPVPVPEQPERLQAVTPQQSSLLEQNDDSFDPQQRESTDGEDIGRRTVSRLNTSSREIRCDRGQIDRGETRSSTQSSDRTNEEAVEPSTTRLQRVNENVGKFNQRFESSTREIGQSTSPTQQTNGKARPRVNLNVGRNSFNRRDVERTRSRFREDYQQRRELTQRIRSLPLEEVASGLGMERDRHDKHKWRGDGCIISINEGKFYDHLAQKGGGGAIDLVMHVQETSFKEAVEWLDSGAFNLPPAHQLSPSSLLPPASCPLPSKPVERPPFKASTPDETKWAAVKDYLVEKRGIPESLVEQLHQQGDLYADSKQNAVFLRKSLTGEVTGASLRGTYKDSQFKGLATGTRREEGWFSVTKGEGQPERIVLTEAPIDTLSAAAIAQKPETTMFISTDGAGSIPNQWLQQQLLEGKQVLIAYDADEAGEQMAQQVLEQLPGSQRIKPTLGKDWNEQLVNANGDLEKQRQSYRQEYLQLQEQVKSNPSFQTASTEKTDIAVAMLILKQDKQANLNRVGQVLSQSEKVREWKRSLPEGEYKTKAKDYITKTYEQASTLRQELISKKQKKCDLEIGLNTFLIS